MLPNSEESGLRFAMDTDRAIMVSLLFFFFIAGAQSVSFNFHNKCTYPVWAGTLSGASSSPLAQTGFELNAGASMSLPAPTGWSGRFWGRTNCSTDSTGKFSCATADCATGSVSCNGAGGIPPATLAEITLSATGGKDYYDISLVDGYNLPVSLSPVGGHGGCKPAICAHDINLICPANMQVTSGTSVVACLSACEALGDPQYCCTGAYASPETCKPTNYSKLFKSACPVAYSYAYDDPTSTFTCIGAISYSITFCP